MIFIFLIRLKRMWIEQREAGENGDWIMKKKINFWRIGVGTVLLSGALAAPAIRWAQPKMLFNPAPALIADPSVYEMEYEPVRVDSGAFSVAGWLVKTPEDVRRGVMLCCLSSSGNRSYELDTALFFSKAGFDVLLFDYPGFADSSGRLSEQGCYAAAEGMFDWLKAQDASRPVWVYGRARGAAVAARLAAARMPRGLVLEGAYPSLRVQMADQLGLFRFLVLWNFQTSEFLKEVCCPVLFVHSVHDREVPIDLGRRVFETYIGTKEFFETGGLHGETVTMCAPAYEDVLLGFVRHSEASD